MLFSNPKLVWHFCTAFKEFFNLGFIFMDGICERWLVYVKGEVGFNLENNMTLVESCIDSSDQGLLKSLPSSVKDGNEACDIFSS